MILGRSLPPFLLLSAVAACGSAPAPEGLVADTLSNGRVFLSYPAQESSDGPTWLLREDLRLGQSDGVDPGGFGKVVAVATDASGKIYVADGLAHEVRIFDADGRQRGVFGGKGSGPGEFRFISGLAAHPDGTLWVMDPGNRRLNIHDSTGALLADLRHGLGPLVTIPWAGSFDRRGRLYDVVSRDDAKALVRYAVSGEELVPSDTLDIPPFHVPQYSFNRDGISFITSVPFSPSQKYTVGPDGSVWLTNSDQFRIHKLDFSGDTLLTIEVRQDPLRLTARQRDSAAAAAGLRKDRIPNHMPAIRFLTVDDEGRVWIMPEGRERGSQVWVVFEPDGRYFGRVHSAVPLDVETVPPVIRAGAVLGVTRDDLDIDYVVRLRLEPNAGADPADS